MKITVKANNKITDVNIIKKQYANTEINFFEFTFEPSYLWSDLEIWLEDEKGQIKDYAKMNISKRNKMQFSK